MTLNASKCNHMMPLRFKGLTPPTQRFLWDDLRKVLHGGQGWLRYKMAKKYRQSVNPWVGRTNVTEDRQQTDLRQQRPERHVVTFR